MSEVEPARHTELVVGGVYKKNEGTAGIRWGLLIGATQPTNGKPTGRMAMQGYVDELVIVGQNLNAWELVARPMPIDGAALLDAEPEPEVDLQQFAHAVAVEATQKVQDKVGEAIDFWRGEAARLGKTVDSVLERLERLEAGRVFAEPKPEAAPETVTNPLSNLEAARKRRANG